MPYIGNQPTSVAFLTDSFSGNGSTTAFTMSVAPANTASVLVAISGVLQDPSTYSVSGTTLTFSAAPPSGTANISARYLGIPASGVTTTAYRTKTEFTATAGQTTFTPPSYTVGFIDVFRNGVLLGSADYTASNGTTVVLTTGATAGDLITTESFYISSVLNAIPATAGAVNSTYLATGAVQQTNLAAGVAGNGPAFSAYSNANQTPITSGVFTKVLFQTKEFDTANCFSSSRFTPNVAGYYLFTSEIDTYTTSGNLTLSILSVYKNGSEAKRGMGAGGTGEVYTTVSAIVYMNGTTDYAEIYGYTSAGAGTIGWPPNGTASNYFQGILVRSA